MFRKTPLAWLQVKRETRLVVALAEIAFADLLMFIQMGFEARSTMQRSNRTAIYRQIWS
jgi:hypothetical protein